MKKRICAILGGILLGLTAVFGTVMPTHATGNSTSENETRKTAKDNDRQDAYVMLVDHKKNLEIKYSISDAAEEKMNAIMYEANIYIATTKDITRDELMAYVEGVKRDMTSVVGSGSIYTSTSKFLYLANEVPVTTANYGQQTNLLLSIINLGEENVTSLVITPNISTDNEKWPFVIQTASDVRTIADVKAAPSASDAYAFRQETAWTFVVRNDVKSGTYPISFHVRYYRNGALEETDLTTFININGAPGKGNLPVNETDKTEETKQTSVPRIIVTGFTTVPEKVKAGDTFQLNITVQNTSAVTSVSNIQFDLSADYVGGTNDQNGYAAFLPTSGSATIYVPSIPAGGFAEITIEMTARSDLSQKPYVVKLNANYEDSKANPYKTEADISVPVYQEARMQVSNVEISPEAANVGDSVNIMFDINNLGKTTLYNTQISFKGETISGGEMFIGTIETGKTGSVDTNVNCIAPTTDDGIIIAVVSYEDEAGNVSTYEHELNLNVFEAVDYEDVYVPDLVAPDEETKAKIPPIVPILAALVVVTVVIIVVVNVNKKKKAKRLSELTRDDDV